MMLMVLVTVKKSQLFFEKYKHLYNTVSYDIYDMHVMESTIFVRLHNCENMLSLRVML